MKVFIEIEQDCTDCRPFTLGRPTALLRVLERSVLERNLDLLKGAGVRVTIVAGNWQGEVGELLSEHQYDLEIVCEHDDKYPAHDVLCLRGDTLYTGEGLAAALAGEIDRLEDGAFRIRYPWHLLEANVNAVRRVSDFRGGQIEDGVVIHGLVHIADGAVIKSGCYIEGPAYIGPRSRIGPFAHIRPDTTIESDCEIGKAELYDCVIMRGTTCKHQGYIGHSVVGEAVNIGAGLITADYRHDAGEHITIVNGKKVATGRTKLGAFIGDGVHTGIGTMIYPGRKIWPRIGTQPGEVVKVDKAE